MPEKVFEVILLQVERRVISTVRCEDASVLGNGIRKTARLDRYTWNRDFRIAEIFKSCDYECCILLYLPT